MKGGKIVALTGCSSNTSLNPRFTKGWWEEFENGEQVKVEKGEGKEKKVVVSGHWNKKINPKNISEKVNENNKLKESEYGKSIKIIVATIGIPDGADVVVQLYKKKGFWPSEDDERIAEELSGYKIKNNKTIMPVYLESEWCSKDKEWYNINKDKNWYNLSEKSIKRLNENLNDRLYFRVSITWGKDSNGIGKGVNGCLANNNMLIVWPQPSLIMHAEAEVEDFCNDTNRVTGKTIKCDIRPVPDKNGWREGDNYKYWYRLGRAYSGLGTKGKQIIKCIYTKRGDVEYRRIEVKDVEWRGDLVGRRDDFEHPAPNNGLKNVGYTGSTDYFKFRVKEHSENGIFIHGSKGSEGCIIIGGQNGDPTNTGSTEKYPKEIEGAIYIWDTMMQLLNKGYENYVNNVNSARGREIIAKKNKKGEVKKYENGAVKISNSTVDNFTKLDYNYGKLHETGLDSVSKDQKLTEDERGKTNREDSTMKITPLTDKEIEQFLKSRGKWEDYPSNANPFKWIIEKVKGARI